MPTHPDDPVHGTIAQASRRRFLRSTVAGTSSAVVSGTLAGCLGGGGESAQAQSADAVPEPSIALSTSVTLHYMDEGSGTAIVFVPGWTCSQEFFQKQADGLKGAYRVIRYDPRGQGQSEKPAEGHSFKQRGRDLAAFIDALGLNRVVLVGWSYGSYDVWAYLAEFGFSKVRGLVVLDQPPKSPFDPADATAWGEVAITADPQNPSAVGAFVRVVIDDRKGFWTAYAKYMLAKPDTTPDSDPEVAQIVAWGLQTPQSVATQAFADGAFSDFSAVARAADAAVPTLYFVREDWADIARAWVSANAPSARFVRIPSHMGFWIDSASFNAALSQFVGVLPA